MLEQPKDMRLLFAEAIKLQEDIIADAKRRIEHYKWALSEMDKENNIIESSSNG